MTFLGRKLTGYFLGEVVTDQRDVNILGKRVLPTMGLSKSRSPTTLGMARLGARCCAPNQPSPYPRPGEPPARGNACSAMALVA